MDVATKTEAAKTAKNLCMSKFKEWWTLQEMIDAIYNLSMGRDILQQIQSSGTVRVDQDSMAEVLYDVVGPRFLRSIGTTRMPGVRFSPLSLGRACRRGSSRRTP